MKWITKEGFNVKICPNCQSECNDEAVFCNVCGARFAQPQQPPQQQYNQQYQPPVYVDPFDHTGEYDARDISENKIFAVLPYLLGIMGIIVALLGCKDSKFARFHIKQELKFTVTNILLGIVTLVLCWTIIVPIAAGIMYIILFIIEIIAFFSACSGKAKEAAIIRSLGFLK